MEKKIHPESHRSQHIGWLRASVLGANDGIISIASLIVGVAAANTTHEQILLTGVAGLVAGALSMAAGEYVSVSSQADTENADLTQEKSELLLNPEFELKELAHIYVERGVDPKLADEVARQLTAHDALGTHLQDELGITLKFRARPIQAALSSAAAFTVGAALPILLVIVSSPKNLSISVSIASLIFLVLLGILATKVGRANIWKSALRITFWGAIAMIISDRIGSIFSI